MLDTYRAIEAGDNRLLGKRCKYVDSARVPGTRVRNLRFARQGASE